MRNGLYSFLLFGTQLAALIVGIPHNACRNEPTTAKRSASCDNIYIWENRKKEFVDASNATMRAPNVKPFESLEGKTVRVIAQDMMPYITSSNYSQNLGGFLGSIWRIVQNALKFKSNVTSCDYDSGLEIMQRGEADVFLAAVVSKKGLRNIKYSQPYFYNWYHLYTKAPEAQPTSSSYLKTLNAGLWFASISMFCILTLSLWSVIQVINRGKIRRERNISLFSCFMVVTSGFLNQGCDIHLARIPCRIIVIFSLVFGLLLYAAMNAVLVAKLATFEVKLPFKSLQDLAVMKTYSLCVRTNSFVYNNFTFENRSVRPEWAKIVNGPGCLNINNQQNLAKILCKNNLVILENRVVMGAVVRNYNVTCPLTYLRKKYFKTANSFLVWQHFEGEKIIDYYIRKVQDCGVMKRLSADYIKTDILENNYLPNSPQVTMQHILGIIGVYALVVVLSLLILLMELLYLKYYPSSGPEEYLK